MAFSSRLHNRLRLVMVLHMHGHGTSTILWGRSSTKLSKIKLLHWHCRCINFKASSVSCYMILCIPTSKYVNPIAYSQIYTVVALVCWTLSCQFFATSTYGWIYGVHCLLPGETGERSTKIRLFSMNQQKWLYQQSKFGERRSGWQNKEP